MTIQSDEINWAYEKWLETAPYTTYAGTIFRAGWIARGQGEDNSSLPPIALHETWHERLGRLVNARDYPGALALLRSPAPHISTTAELTIADIAGYERPLRCTLAEMEAMADWIERTKPQGLLYDSCRPVLQEGAIRLREMERYASLGQAAEAAGLTGYNDDASIWLAPPREAP